MFNPRTPNLLSLFALAIGGLGFALLIGLQSGLADTASQQTTPSSLQPCIRQLNTKRTPIKASFISGTYREGVKTYHFLHLFPSRMELGVRDAIIASGPTGCRTLAHYSSGNPIPVTAAVPLSVAQHLTLNTLKSDISEFGGPQKYQAFLNSAAQDTGKLYMDSNKVWALKQLGIRILPSIKILPPPSEGQANDE